MPVSLDIVAVRIPCGIGDWAVALRSPDGSLAARVCPFGPAYWASWARATS